MFQHFLFFCRLRDAGLLTLSRLVEVGPIQLDRSLLTALVDRWRPETHTFHLPCGEMTPTLQDVAYLLGLPIVGEAVGPRVVAASWKDELEARFALVDRYGDGLLARPSYRLKATGLTLQVLSTEL